MNSKSNSIAPCSASAVLSKAPAAISTRSAVLCRRRIVVACVNFVVLLLAWAVEQLIGERFWLANLICYLPQQPFVLPTLILLAIALWKRHRAAIGINALSLCFFALTMGGFNVPIFNASQSTAEQSKGARPLRVMTYNVLGGSRGVDGLMRVIQAQNPDVLCLQEAEAFGTGPDPTRLIARALPKYFHARAEEVTTFSRFPIIGQRSHAFTFAPRIQRRILETTLSIDGRAVTVFNIHNTTISVRPTPPKFTDSLAVNIADSARRRSEEIALLESIVSKTKTPFLVCGDFNTPPRGVFYRRLAARWNDSFALRGWGTGHTFRSDWPLLRIDYIWSNRNWRAQNCFVTGDEASDHRALVADFKRDF